MRGGAHQRGQSIMAKWVYSFGDGEAEGKRGDARSPRRQGRQPRRDGQSRPAGAARLHHHHRGLHPLLRQRPELSRRPRGRGRRGARRHRADHRQDARRRRAPAPRLGPLRRPRLDAGHDGHRPQSRPQRPDGRGARGERRQALRLRFLPPLHPDVFRRRARHRPPPLRGAARGLQGRARLHARHRPRPATTGRSSSATTRSSSSARAARRSRRIRRSSSGARSAPSSSPG